MSDISIFCLTLNPSHGEFIKKLSYIPVGLGSENFSREFYNDKNGNNISFKNPNYGEYTFHYWLWKNHLNNIKTKWVGFCQYRKFFIQEIEYKQNLNFDDLNNLVIKNLPKSFKKYDCILGKKFSVQNYKISKIIKNHLLEFLKRPNLLINKEKRNLKFHFDLFHGKGNLDLAIDLLDDKNRSDFKEFMSQSYFNPHNMFICRTEILKEYYQVIFPWLEKCENLFGFNKLKGYGEKRIYGFLAERFLSYWFNKNYIVKEIPILFKDLTDYKNL